MEWEVWGRFRKKETYVYLWLIHIEVCQEPAHSCKASILQLKMNKLRKRRYSFDLWVGKCPWRRQWQPAPVYLPEKFHGQRSLVGYSPWDCQKLDMTEQLSTHTIILCSTFWGNAKSLSLAGAPFYIPNSSAQGFQFSHILANTCYFLFLIVCSYWWEVVSHCPFDLHFDLY